MMIIIIIVIVIIRRKIAGGGGGVDEVVETQGKNLSKSGDSKPIQNE
jgi:hypothetical protein